MEATCYSPWEMERLAGSAYLSLSPQCPGPGTEQTLEQDGSKGGAAARGGKEGKGIVTQGPVTSFLVS